jgi:hypothetical protein
LRGQCPVDDLVVVDGQPFVAWRVIEDIHEYCSACPVAGGLAQDALGAGPVAWNSSPTCLALRALSRLRASSRHTRRRAPMPGSISHQAPEAISIAERASTVGPITGIRLPSTW